MKNSKKESKTKKVKEKPLTDTTKKSISPFDFLNNINAGTRGEDMLKDCYADNTEFLEIDSADKSYNAFIINRGLSNFIDTVLFANAMNERAALPAKMQYDFYRNSIRPCKRFAKWSKKIDDTEDVKLLMKRYNYSSEKARDALKLYTETELQKLRDKSDVGGIKK